jgi:hypothetical protein
MFSLDFIFSEIEFPWDHVYMFEECSMGGTSHCMSTCLKSACLNIFYSQKSLTYVKDQKFVTCSLTGNFSAWFNVYTGVARMIMTYMPLITKIIVVSISYHVGVVYMAHLQLMRWISLLKDIIHVYWLVKSLLLSSESLLLIFHVGSQRALCGLHLWSYNSRIDISTINL